MPNKATTISVAQLSTAAHAAAKSALAAAKLPHVTVDPGIVIDGHWIIGIILRNADIQHIAQYQHVAAQVADHVRKAELNPQPEPPGVKAAINPQPLPPKASESIYMYDHIVICGYRPILELPTTVAH